MSSGLGVAVPWQHAEQRGWWYETVLRALKPDWWYNYKFDQIGQLGYVPMMYDASVFDDAVQTAAHETWLVLNEPEREDQGNLSPENGAALVNDFSLWTERFIAAPGIIVDDVGLDWLDRYLSYGGKVPDIWTVHIYAANGEEWHRAFTRFYYWLSYRNIRRPIWVTETACIQDSEQSRRSVLNAIGSTLQGGSWLDRVAWFSSHYGSYKPEYTRSDLLDKDGNVTELGRQWIDEREYLDVAAERMMTLYLPQVHA